MAPSQIDCIHFRSWSLAILTNLLTFANVLVFAVSAHFPGLGLPCSYFDLVDPTTVNLTTYNVIHHFTPQLYLAPTQLIVHVAFTLLTFALACAYYVWAWVHVRRRLYRSKHAGQAHRNIEAVGDVCSAFLFTLTMDTFQLFLLTLAFRLPALVATASALHLAALMLLTTRIVTQHRSFDDVRKSLSGLHRRLRGTVRLKTLLANLMETTLAYELVVASLSLGLGLGNSFYVSSATALFGTINVFGTLMTAMFIALELHYHPYVKMHVGLHIGTLAGLFTLLVPVLRYENLYATEYTPAIHINLAVIATIWLGFVIIRLVRLYRRRQWIRYRQLPKSEDTHVYASVPLMGDDDE